MASEKVLNLTDDNFDEAVASGYALVDFWAEWCGPCRALGPTIDQLAEEMEGKLKVCKVDVDNNQEIPSRFGVRGIPMIILLQEGKLVDSVTGNDPTKVKALAAQAIAE